MTNCPPSLQEIRDRISQTRNYTPKVGIFGNSGVGKSSLCNTLFGQKIAATSDVKSCTREQQSIYIGQDSISGIELIDLPGIGEDQDRHREYISLYEKLSPQLDLVLWAIKSDDRNYASSIEAYNIITNNHPALPIIFVITQSDKTNPTREWDYETFSPSEKQLSNIAVKENEVSSRYSVPTSRIISVAVDEHNFDEKYNVVQLVDLVVRILPNEKKYAFAREARDDNVSEDSREQAEEGLWESIKEFAGEAWGSVREVVIKEIIESAPVVFQKAATTIGRWFKKLL